MQYLLTGIEDHPDKGFGITADAYYQSAEHLRLNPFETYNSTPQAEMPQSFLYRHSIELYLKSLIIIFHRQLKLNYGTTNFASDEPEILDNGTWRKLYTCHYIDVLFDYWLNSLYLPNREKLEKEYPPGDWILCDEIAKLFPIICKYDKDSSYFRYPVTKNSSLDSKKFTMQKFDPKNFEEFINKLNSKQDETKKGRAFILQVDQNENIVKAFQQELDILPDVRDALREVAYFFNCFHVMTRIVLCKGF